MKTIAIIGCGQMGRYYADILVKKLGYPPGCICCHDIIDSRALALGNDFGIAVRNELPLDVDAAIIAANTPAHFEIISALARGGVRHALCESGIANILSEKPLAQNVVQIRKIQALQVERPDLTIHTALVIQFSPVFDTLIGLMQSENLVLREFSGYWGKNRGKASEKRPTAGDRTDEFLWMLEACLALLRPHGLASATVMSALVGYLDFADAEAQRVAHERDDSFPLKPDNSTRVHISFDTDAEHDVRADFTSSFILPKQERRIAGVMTHAGTDEPAVLFEVNFDHVEPDKETGKPRRFDRLLITRCRTDEKQVLEFSQDNLVALTRAFVGLVAGGAAHEQLAPVSQASLCVRILEAIDTVDQARRKHAPRFVTVETDPARTAAACG